MKKIKPMAVYTRRLTDRKEPTIDSEIIKAKMLNRITFKNFASHENDNLEFFLERQRERAIAVNEGKEIKL